MKHLLLSLTILLALVSCGQPDYDTILKNGLIYDGSGDKPYQADVAIKADTVAAIGDLSEFTAVETIDLNGLAVAPGFINMLSWANTALLEDGRSQGDMRQGVTLEVLGEGSSMGPLTDSMKLDMSTDQGDIKYEVKWTTLGEYLQYLEEKGISTNVASFVGNGTLRKYAVGNENRKATPEELEEMKGLVKQAMEEGAVGISSSLLYAPSGYADTPELIELAKVASEYNGMYISHIRSEGSELLEAINELITISREANISAEVYHLKASGQDYWNKLDTAIMLIEDARKEGLAVTADIYTYPASSTGLHVQLPDWVREEGVEATIKRLADSTLRERILSEIEFTNPPSSIMLVGFKNEELRKYTGMRLDEVAEQLGKTSAEAMIDLIVEDDSRIQVVYFSMSEENIAKKVAVPWVSFCSDAGSYTNEGVFIKSSTHPRAYGSFIRVLGKYARDEKVITLEEGIRKLSSLPAQNLKLEKRGMLKPGYYADVVVFDPEKVNDKATFEKPHQYAEGIVHVWVNGTSVLKNGEHTGANAGRFVKGPGYKGI
ncbi:N-acyl-D-amino-acid deacylase family protein [Fulvivirga lutimaris]|uniref:N-acyl-D-amino-acid deacylase family protein n=1 Tax=Fulvivirga lutimaris TaxID=1819566 RepID=UPI0012BC11B4|nr:D-aminoacylase [Fulvivirga lutimaris]MTI39842.1 D-aminoacylase [Fulvivirga lutimaris]